MAPAEIHPYQDTLNQIAREFVRLSGGSCLLLTTEPIRWRATAELSAIDSAGGVYMQTDRGGRVRCALRWPGHVDPDRRLSATCRDTRAVAEIAADFWRRVGAPALPIFEELRLEALERNNQRLANVRFFRKACDALGVPNDDARQRATAGHLAEGDEMRAVHYFGNGSRIELRTYGASIDLRVDVGDDRDPLNVAEAIGRAMAEAPTAAAPTA